MKDRVARQLTAALQTRTNALSRLLAGSADLLTLGDLEQAAEDIAARLREPGPHLRELVPSLMAALWPETSPPTLWWSSALGRAVERTGLWDRTSLSHSEAGRMLGVTRQAISGLVQRGRLDPHEDGGVTRDSVLTRRAQTLR